MVGFATLKASKFVEAEAVAAAPMLKLAFAAIVGTKLPPTELLSTDIIAANDFAVKLSASSLELLSLADITKLLDTCDTPSSASTSTFVSPIPSLKV